MQLDYLKIFSSNANDAYNDDDDDGILNGLLLNFYDMNKMEKV